MLDYNHILISNVLKIFITNDQKSILFFVDFNTIFSHYSPSNEESLQKK
jgi:hypothetical protein